MNHQKTQELLTLKQFKIDFLAAINKLHFPRDCCQLCVSVFTALKRRALLSSSSSKSYACMIKQSWEQLRVSHELPATKRCESRAHRIRIKLHRNTQAGFCYGWSPEQVRPVVFWGSSFNPFVTRPRRSQACLLFPEFVSAFHDLFFASQPRAVMLVQSFGPRLQESECWAVTNAKTHVVRRVSRSGSLRPVSTAQKVPPNKEPQESRRDRLERAITSFRTPARAAAQKVSSSRTCPVTVTPLSRLAIVLTA